MPARTNLDHTTTVRVEYNGPALVPVPFGGKAGNGDRRPSSTARRPDGLPASRPTRPRQQDMDWDFAGGEKGGWSCGAISECGQYGKVCGGYGVKGGYNAEITKTVTPATRPAARTG